MREVQTRSTVFVSFARTREQRTYLFPRSELPVHRPNTPVTLHHRPRHPNTPVPLHRGTQNPRTPVFMEPTPVSQYTGAPFAVGLSSSTRRCLCQTGSASQHTGTSLAETSTSQHTRVLVPQTPTTQNTGAPQVPAHRCQAQRQD